MMQNSRASLTSSAYYDAYFSANVNAQKYQRHYRCLGYFSVYEKVREYLGYYFNDAGIVLDIGCGPGLLAHYLYDEGIRDYIGFDFSEVAVGMASERVPEFKFLIADELKPDVYSSIDYDIAIATEILEHLEDDFKCLGFIKSKAGIIISMPNHQCSCHVRCIESVQQMRERYSGMLEIYEVSFVWRNFVLVGEKI